MVNEDLHRLSTLILFLKRYKFAGESVHMMGLRFYSAARTKKEEKKRYKKLHHIGKQNEIIFSMFKQDVLTQAHRRR